MDPVLAELITLSGFAVRDYMKMDLSQQFVFVNRYADYLEWKMKCETNSFITLNISSFVLTSTQFLFYHQSVRIICSEPCPNKAARHQRSQCTAVLIQVISGCMAVGGDHDCEKKKMAEFAALVKRELRKTMSAMEQPRKWHAAEVCRPSRN